MIDYEELILTCQDAQDIAEDEGTAPPVDVCIECAYYKPYNIKRNVCFPEAYFTGFCRIHETNVNKLESCPAFLEGGAANAE